MLIEFDTFKYVCRKHCANQAENCERKKSVYIYVPKNVTTVVDVVTTVAAVVVVVNDFTVKHISRKNNKSVHDIYCFFKSWPIFFRRRMATQRFQSDSIENLYFSSLAFCF